VDCPHIPELGYAEFSKQLAQKFAGQRIPISGSVELTFRCNLRCVHCYVACGNNSVSAQEELTTAEWCSVLDQIADKGCLWLLLTGGELLARPDFLDLYTHAKRKGLLLTLFTNGTLLTPRIADYLAEYLPFSVEISLYGRTQETYERVTGVPGSYARCMRGIELLLERGIPLRLKTMLMTLNKHELWDIKAYAESLDVRFHFDPMINAGVDGSGDPTVFRLPPEEIVQFEMADSVRWKGWLDFWERYEGVRTDPTCLYTCGAGVNTFHVDPYGGLSVCMVARAQQYDLRQGSFEEGWRGFLYDVRYQRPKGGYHCNECELLSFCGQCPGWAHMEHGNQQKPVEFLCRVAHERAEAMGASVQPEHQTRFEPIMEVET
jgi:radical SAM protein with 4Fe4S-binding SPASM domain